MLVSPPACETLYSGLGISCALGGRGGVEPSGCEPVSAARPLPEGNPLEPRLPGAKRAYAQSSCEEQRGPAAGVA